MGFLPLRCESSRERPKAGIAISFIGEANLSFANIAVVAHS